MKKNILLLIASIICCLYIHQPVQAQILSDTMVGIGDPTSDRLGIGNLLIRDPKDSQKEQSDVGLVWTYISSNHEDFWKKQLDKQLKLLEDKIINDSYIEATPPKEGCQCCENSTSIKQKKKLGGSQVWEEIWIDGSIQIRAD